MDNQQMFRQLADSPLGNNLIKHLEKRLVECFGVESITGEVQLEAAKKSKKFIKEELIDKINAFSGNQTVGEGEEEFR